MKYRDDLKEYIYRLIGEWVRKPPGANPWHRHGTVVSMGTTPVIRFDGEEESVSRALPYVQAYTATNLPQAGDRVYLVKSGQTWLVVGKIIS